MSGYLTSKILPADPAKCDHANAFFMANGQVGDLGYVVTVCPRCGRLAVALLEKGTIEIFLPARAHLQAIAQHYQWLDGQGRSYQTPISRVPNVAESLAAKLEEDLEDGGDREL